MNINNIKTAVDAGKTVHWVNASYVVRKDRLGQYLIVFLPNGSAIGLTNRTGTELNGAEDAFFIADCEAPVRGVRREGRVIYAAPSQSTNSASSRREGREKVESRLSVL